MTETSSAPRLRAVGRTIREKSARLRPLFIPLCILTGVYTLAISAILRANVNYIDDMGRVFEGYRNWGFGRYLSNFFSMFVHADAFLTDVSPLPQLLAVVQLAAASVCVLFLLTGKKRFTVWEYAAVLPLGLSPYILECLTYKFDAPYMAFSVLVSVLPLLLAAGSRAPRWKLLGPACFISALAMCSSYQAASGVLPMLTALLAFKWWLAGRSWRDILGLIVPAAVGYCAAVVLFKFCFVATVDFQGYVSTGMPPIGELFPSAAEHLRTYFTTIWEEFDGKWLVLIGLLCPAFVWAALRDARRNRVLALVLALLMLAVLALLSFGLYTLLEIPIYNGRSMYGLGVALALAGVFAATGSKVLPGKLVCLALAWCFFVFSFTYGNALNVQQTYTEFRLEEVVDSLKQTDAMRSDGPIIAQLKGSIGYAPAIQGTIDRFPILEKLIPVTFVGTWRWGCYALQNYYGLPDMVLLDNSSVTSLDLTNMDLPVLEETIYHTISGREGFLLIRLK